MKKGISLIALIITIAIIIIVASVTIQNGFKRTDEAKLAAHNHTISELEEKVQTYYYFKGGELPIKKDSSNNSTTYPIPSGSSLESEVNKNGDGGDKLYVIDMNKLGAKNDKQGTGVGDDVFLVSETRHNVYYAKGDTVKGLTYHGKINKNNIQLTNANFDGKVNKPKLSSGMEPVTWNGTQWGAIDSSNRNNEWYDYSKSANKWANCRLNDGSMLVWIPRYTYKILNNEHTGSTGISGDIDVKFSEGTTDDTAGGYRIHPAFYWGGWTIPANADMIKQPGGAEITGIWVGKFEVSSNSSKIRITANQTSWKDINVSNIFDTARNMNKDTAIYGIASESDTHMLKNSEWGATIYLSKYALGNVEIAPNLNSSYITANGNIVANKSQSSTGNEYGIYDINGCSWEYLACYINNGNDNLNKYGSSLVVADAKYKDIFPLASTDQPQNNYNLTSRSYGHAFWETSDGFNAWFNRYCDFINTDRCFVIRSGDYNMGLGMFSFSSFDGNAFMAISWRVAITLI